jgi:hypothetical protein
LDRGKKKDDGIFLTEEEESRGERRRRRTERERKNADTQTAEIQRTFAPDQLNTHDNIIDQSDVFPFVLVRVF